MFSHPHSQVTVTNVQGIPGYCLSCQQVGVICAGFAGINMHELQDPGDFHLGFKERPGRHNSLAGEGRPEKARGDTVTEPKTQWTFWDVDVRKRRRVSAEESLGSKSSIAYQERPHELQMAMPQQRGCPHPSELTSCQHLSQCWIWSCAFNVSPLSSDLSLLFCSTL